LQRLREKYEKEVVPAMIKEFGYRSIMAVPKLKKVVMNMGVGDAIFNVKALDKSAEELTLIAGQKAVITKAKKSIASFKLREGMPIGCTVTLRRGRMYDFLDKFFNILADWGMYLSPLVERWLHVSPPVFMRGVGVMEMAVETAPWASGSRLFFPRSSMTRLKKSEGSMCR
jgi:hypothetical protein